MTEPFDNPMGLMGFEFVEFASPTPNVLEPLFEQLGFTLVAKHRSKDVLLYRQGGANFIVTLSGPLPEQGGSLLERSVGGRQPLRLSNGQARAFLEDGDAITLRGRCTRAGLRSIGFGTCSAK